MKHTERLKNGKIQSDARVIADDEHIVVVKRFKYLGWLKSSDGNWSRDNRSRIGMGKKIRLDMVPIWRDRGMNKYMKMKLVRSLVCTVLTYGAECWTLTKPDETMIESAELWI